MTDLLQKLLIIIVCLLLSYSGNAQKLLWEETIGGDQIDWLEHAFQNKEGNYVFSGYSYSGISGDKKENSRGDGDFWILETDMEGRILWQKTIGGSYPDMIIKTLQLADGTYLLAGSSYSGISGEKSESNRGDRDLWLIKLDEERNITWQRTYGGNAPDVLSDIISTGDGGFLAVVESSSGISGDKTTAPMGKPDLWVLKLDLLGEIEWQKSFGGNGQDTRGKLHETKSGNFVIAASSSSGISGNKTAPSRGLSDYWIFEINPTAEILWQKTIGGDNGDSFKSLIPTADGGYLMGGDSGSEISGEKELPVKSFVDLWLVKLDSRGSIQWQNTYAGGDNIEWLSSISPSVDSGYLLAAMSSSDSGNDKTEPGGADRNFWMLKITEEGIVCWDKSLGGSSTDQPRYGFEDNRGNFIMGGWTDSDASGDKSENSMGERDFWITKIAQPEIVQPVGNISAPVTACDFDGDGFASFDLYSLEKELLRDQENVRVTYYDEDWNPLPSPHSFVNTVKDSQRINVRLTNTKVRCAQTELQVLLQVSSCEETEEHKDDTNRTNFGFCEGSKGDPIFHEDFRTAGPLPQGITSYDYVTGDPQDGFYTISNRTGAEIDSWHSYLPNSTISNGNALVVNAAYTSGQFYKTTISGLCQNTTYEFSAYLLNVYNRSSQECKEGGIPVNVRFEIWDASDSVLLESADTGDISSTGSPQWEQFALTFQSEAQQESIILKMFNNGDGGCGNDLAIDDIIFRSCGDLTTIAHEGAASTEWNICEEDTPVNISLKATPDHSVYSQHFFQWQESTDKENWQDIPGETGDTYTASSLSSSRYFRVRVAEDAANLRDNLCSSATEAFHLNILSTPKAPVSTGDRQICSNEPFPGLAVQVESDETVNWYDASTGGNLLARNTSTFTPEEGGTYYAEAVKEGYDCPPGERTAVSLHVFQAPGAEDVTVYLCENSVISLDAGPANMHYLWSSGETGRTNEVDQSGNYWVEITSGAGCTVTRDIEVVAVRVPVIREVISEERSVKIILEEEGDFLFSLNGSAFQQSYLFEEVKGGIYTAYVKDQNDCNTVTTTFAHIVIPTHITPNNDGYNDHFELPGISFFNGSTIRIFDRYGNLLKAGSGENFRWDGTFNGKALPPDDYWYEIAIEGFENRKGHFSLLR